LERYRITIRRLKDNQTRVIERLLSNEHYKNIVNKIDKQTNYKILNITKCD